MRCMRMFVPCTLEAAARRTSRAAATKRLLQLSLLILLWFASPARAQQAPGADSSAKPPASRTAEPQSATQAPTSQASPAPEPAKAGAPKPPPRPARPPQMMGLPPPEATAVVQAPKAFPEEPKLERKLDGTMISIAAGGQHATGNSQLLALSVNGSFETRWHGNAVGLSLLANYGESAPPEADTVATTENIQGRVRYDRYLIDRASLFVINTLRHDRFQGVDLRYNLDPGFKYLLLKVATSSLWAEAGYDFEYDVRRDDARLVEGGFLLDKTSSDHSLRAFGGFRHAFNAEVSLSSGAEYLQSIVAARQFRLNYDLLFSAKVSAALALGFAFNLRYDHSPLPDKRPIDTSTTISLIYAFSNVQVAAPPPAPPE
jgi:putative salt-induced outer membrane protein